MPITLTNYASKSQGREEWGGKAIRMAAFKASMSYLAAGH